MYILSSFNELVDYLFSEYIVFHTRTHTRARAHMIAFYTRKHYVMAIDKYPYPIRGAIKSNVDLSYSTSKGSRIKDEYQLKRSEGECLICGQAQRYHLIYDGVVRFGQD